MGESFPHLFSALTIGGMRLRNRVFSTGHQTNLAEQGMVGEKLIAYHQARARGGAGLIIVEVAAIHESATYNEHIIVGYDDRCIPGYRRLAEVVHSEGCRLFAQLFHPGSETFRLLSDGTQMVAWAPSAMTHERYLLSATPMPGEMVEALIEGYGDTALRMQAAGLDGVEVVASHGYLPIQFLNPRLNQRDDQWGGSFENRLRFMVEIATNIRNKVGDDFVVGLRISGNEMDPDRGVTEAESLEALVRLDELAAYDYFNVTAGSTASSASVMHVVPPMYVDTGYVAPFAATVKNATSVPIFVAGRINQPHTAESIIASAKADMCGMTRAQICDPEMANKARSGRSEDIRACIGCNQACIGHQNLGVGISCIQYPESGRELEFGSLGRAATPKRVMVVGAGHEGSGVRVRARSRSDFVRARRSSWRANAVSATVTTSR
mgnify:CR=1 FL=1